MVLNRVQTCHISDNETLPRESVLSSQGSAIFTRSKGLGIHPVSDYLDAMFRQTALASQVKTHSMGYCQDTNLLCALISENALANP